MILQLLRSRFTKQQPCRRWCPSYPLAPPPFPHEHLTQGPVCFAQNFAGHPGEYLPRWFRCSDGMFLKSSHTGCLRFGLSSVFWAGKFQGVKFWPPPKKWPKINGILLAHIL